MLPEEVRCSPVIYLILIVLVLAQVSCKTIAQRKAIKDCKFRLDDVVVESISLEDIKLRVKLLVTNPNDIKVVVDSFEYQIYIQEDILVSTGVHTEMLEIEPEQEGGLNLSLTINSKEVGRALLATILSGGVDLTLKGTVHVKTWIGTIDYPLELTKRI